MATTRWKPGRVGSYRLAENWSDGAPGPGDTAVVAGARSSVLLYAPGNDPRRFSPNPAPPGDTVTGQALLFQADAAATASAPVQATLSNSTLAADTVLEASGPGLTELLAWFDNTLAGRIAVAEGGELRLTMLSDWPPGGVPPAGDAGLPTTTNSGRIEVGPDAEFWLQPLVGGTNWYLDAYGH